MMIREMPVRLVVLFATSFLATTASAQSPPPPATPVPTKPQPTQQEIDRARQYFAAADAAKVRQDYKAAAADYLAAYQLYNDPEFFFNAGEMYRLAGDGDSALNYYQKYLNLAPNGRGAPTARATIADLRRATSTDGNAPSTSAPAERPPGDPAGTESSAPRALAVSATTPSQPIDSPASHGRLRIAGISTAAIGVVALGASLAFGIHAQTISDEASRWTMFDKARYDEGKAANRNMWIFAGAGAAAVIAGSVLYYVGYRADASHDAGHTRITLALPDGTRAMSVRAEGRF